MKTTLYKSLAAGLLALTASPLLASAQTTSYPSYSPYSSYPATSCVTLTSYQQVGSSDVRIGGQVSVLQQFLNRTGYLNGVTGYFDGGTYGAVVNYQRTHGILPTGTVGPVTRASINQQSCGNSSYINQYPNQYPNTSYSVPSLTSFSVTSAMPGTSVTVYGSNLAANNAVVHFGANTVAASYSTNNSIAFVVPYLSAGTYQIYVANSNGTSNSMSFSVLASNSNGNCAWSGNSYQCGTCGYWSNGTYYNSCSNNNSNNSNYNYPNANNGTWFGGNNQPSISSVTGQGSVPAGATNTWSVNAYSQTNLGYTIRVDWGDGSSQSSSPSYGTGTQSYPFTHTYNSSGSYTIRFTATDSTGAYAYSTMPVSVYGTGYNNSNNYGYNVPAISSLSTSGAARGSTITIYGSNLNSNMTVMLTNSSGSYAYTTTYANGSNLNFTVPYINTGTYSLSVSNGSGQGSNSLSFTVY